MPSAGDLTGLPTAAGPVPPGAASASVQAGSALSSSALLSNLLPVLGKKSALGSPGIYIGEGLPPVPTKLAEKIRRWEFTEMADLLPEYWGGTGYKTDEEETESTRRAPARRKRKVTEIGTWLQCFGTYIAVLAGSSPEAVPELVAYQIFILGASQDFEGLAWVTYDSAFQRQAAATGNRCWSRVNPSLHSICFGGAAKRAVRCDLCLSLTHPTRECALVSDPDPEVGTRLKTLEVALLAFTGNQTATGAVNSLGGPRPLSGSQEWFSGGPEPCRKWNAKRCGYRRCRHPHVCNLCGGPHPAVECRGSLTGPVGGAGPLYGQWIPQRPMPEDPLRPRGGFGPTRGQHETRGAGRPY